MTRPYSPRNLQFFLTAPAPCPYRDGFMERKVFAHLDRTDGPSVNAVLTQAGFRRSQNIIYRPACENCDACLSARVPVNAFAPTRTQRRIAARNIDLVRLCRAPEPTEEQFALFSAYLETRHEDGGMTGMTFGDYAAMVADTPADTGVVEYRDPARDGALVAAALVDRLVDGYSMVYSFFDTGPDARRSLGVYMILDQIRRAGEDSLGFIFLGYWVQDSEKMAYKARFRPLEILGPAGWSRLEPGTACP